MNQIEKSIEDFQHAQWLKLPATFSQISKLEALRTTLLTQAEDAAVSLVTNDTHYRNKLIQAHQIRKLIEYIKGNSFPVNS